MRAASSGSPLAAALAASMGSADLESPSGEAKAGAAKLSEAIRAKAVSEARIFVLISTHLIGSPPPPAEGRLPPWWRSWTEDSRSRGAAGWAGDHARARASALPFPRRASPEQPRRQVRCRIRL